MHLDFTLNHPKSQTRALSEAQATGVKSLVTTWSQSRGESTSFSTVSLQPLPLSAGVSLVVLGAVPRGILLCPLLPGPSSPIPPADTSVSTCWCHYALHLLQPFHCEQMTPHPWPLLLASASLKSLLNSVEAAPSPPPCIRVSRQVDTLLHSDPRPQEIFPPFSHFPSPPACLRRACPQGQLYSSPTPGHILL